MTFFLIVILFLFQFYSLLEASPIANISLLHRHVTIFAPTNQAFQKYKGRTDVLYHIGMYLQSMFIYFTKYIVNNRVNIINHTINKETN